MSCRLLSKLLVLVFAVSISLWASGWLGIAEATTCEECFYGWSNCDDNCNHCFYDYPDGDPRVEICFQACEDRCWNRYNNCLDTCTP